ncbi:MAG: nucleotide sugar dehydrogenase, partial [candidate division Zixibacteria bacterium]|nr:nucleotide sugar dehydrogenase [candidate division Zixibacteria bacterium]
MKISVFGLGYVGTVTAGYFAAAGHDVTGVDINQTKIDLINSQRSPVYESGMDELISDVVGRGLLKATFDARAALHGSDISFITIGTPSDSNGEVDTTYLKRVCAKLGQVFGNKSRFHTFVVRSTLFPGMTDEVVVPIIEENSGKKVFIDFDICVNPQFLRVGSLVEDYENPPFTLIGQTAEAAGDRVAKLYSDVNATVVRTSIRAAEMIKYASDSFHALKISFANEIGTICKQVGIDSHEIMKIFRMDEKMNLSGSYLAPGFGFGGPSAANNIRALLRNSGLEKP